MSTVTVNRTTALRGRQLQDAVAAMVQELSSQSPYSMFRPTYQWTTGARLVLAAGEVMAGSVTLQDGSPSRVIAEITLSGVAAGQGPRVVQDINAIADRRLGSQGAAAPATTTPPRQESAPRDSAPSATTSRQRVSAEEAISVTTGILDAIRRAADTVGAALTPERTTTRTSTGRTTSAPPPDPSKPRPTAEQLSTIAPNTPIQSPIPWGWIIGGGVALTAVVVTVAVVASRPKE